MKKLSLVIALALVMALTFGTAAFAAQAINGAGFGGVNTYQATPTTNSAAYNDTGDPAKAPASAFKADGQSNYPYEIYLPNEKSPENYRIHSNYTKNTDSCASCHATHTAVGASLLQWYSTYETCMACHDGTVSTTYNVEDGKIGITDEPTFGGAFGDNLDRDAHYASSHNVKGSVSIAAAPGGSVVADTAKAEGGKEISMWQTTFGCQSCHSPHGQGGNARVLHPDPNGWATKMSEGVSFELRTVAGATYAYANNNKVTLIKGYPYTISFFNADGTKSADVITVSNANGVSEFTGVATAAYVKGTASIRVQMNIKNYLGGKLDPDTPDTDNPEDVQHIAGINNYCGACHVDYNTESQVNVNGDEIMGAQENRPGYGALTGVYSSAHRHAVGLPWNYGNAADTDYIGIDGKIMKTMGSIDGEGKDQSKLSCLTCHFAHGVNDYVWEAWITATNLSADWASLDKKEISGSSALKRLPNMATCEACHQKQSAAEGYAANTTQNGVTPASDLGDNYLANAAHEAYFAGNTYQDARTCATCHASAVNDFMGSVHWTWGTPATLATKDFFGKEFKVQDSLIFTPNPVMPGAPAFKGGMPFGMSDRFCGLPGGAGGVSMAYTFKDASGYTQDASSCGKCHPSIGINMPPLFLSFMGQNDQSMQKNVDCLACHISTEEYDSTINKVVEGTGMMAVFKYGNNDRGATPMIAAEGQENNPLASAITVARPDFVLAKVGKEYKIQTPTNENCMTCHEHGQTGPVYKRHGAYFKTTDIHAAKNMDCMECHSTSRHMIAKGIAATDLISNDRPDVAVSCVAAKCHTAQPHNTNKHGATDEKVTFLNKHTAKLACQACHVNTDTDEYAKAARDFFNRGQKERGYATIINAQVSDTLSIFKGGALYNDFRMLSPDGITSGFQDNATNVQGYLNGIEEWGATEWQMAVPGNYAWRWSNGQGTGMANAVASFGFYDPYYWADGFPAFRGTTQLPAPAGFGSGPNAEELAGYAGIDGMPQLFAGYWANYYDPDMFAGKNDFDREYYNKDVLSIKGGTGDKIYPFRKLQAWMPVPRTNFWFLTPHDLATMKDPAANANRNYDSIMNAIESPMMYMYFSTMFKPAMDLYAQEFGFEYKWKDNTIAPQPADLAALPGLGMLYQAGLFNAQTMLNGYIYDSKGYWIDDYRSNGTAEKIWHGDMTGADWAAAGVTVTPAPAEMGPMVSYHPTSAAAGQALLQAGQLDTYMYFPMPLDANIMNDHAIAAKGFATGQGTDKYEPRVCTDCHNTPNGGSADPKPFDNPDWNPLVANMAAPEGPMVFTANEWVKNFDGNNVFDWVTLGYTTQEIGQYTTTEESPLLGGKKFSEFN